jgi:hypothetical protein
VGRSAGWWLNPRQVKGYGSLAAVRMFADGRGAAATASAGASTASSRSPADAFRAIVAAVERSLFGGRALDAADWQDCRAAYERFAFAEAWR